MTEKEPKQHKDEAKERIEDSQPGQASEQVELQSETRLPEPTQDAPPPATSVRGLMIALVLVAVFLLGSLAASLWYFAQYGLEVKATLVERIDNQGAEIDRLSAQIGQVVSEDTVSRQLAGLRDQLTPRIEALRSELTGEIEALRGRMDQALLRAADAEKAIAEIREELGRDDLAWRLAEVNFLLTRAQERLYIARDPDGALIAIEQADQRLAGLALPELIPAREAMATVREQLVSLPVLDRVGWSLELRVIAETVPHWPLLKEAPKAESLQEEPQEETSPEALPWYQNLAQRSWLWLRSQVSISRDDRSVKAESRVAIDRETRLWITAVREAVIDRDSRQTRAAIAALRDWVQSQYYAEDPQVAALLNLLADIETGLVEAELPNLNAVFAALRQARLPLPAKLNDNQGGNGQ